MPCSAAVPVVHWVWLQASGTPCREAVHAALMAQEMWQRKRGLLHAASALGPDPPPTHLPAQEARIVRHAGESSGSTAWASLPMSRFSAGACCSAVPAKNLLSCAHLQTGSQGLAYHSPYQVHGTPRRQLHGGYPEADIIIVYPFITPPSFWK